MNSRNSGVPRILSRLTAVCCMLLPHNPYRLPKHYKRQVCGPSCSCKHRYLWVSPIFEHYISLIYMGYSMPLTTILVTKQFLFHRPVLIFQPTENSRASINQSMQCQKAQPFYVTLQLKNDVHINGTLSWEHQNFNQSKINKKEPLLLLKSVIHWHIFVGIPKFQWQK